MEFRQDGTAVLSTTVILNLFYRASEDRLSVSDTPESDKPETTTFRLDRDQLRMPPANGAEVTKTRMKGSKGHSIVGDWEYRHYTGSTAYERYTEDGRLLFRLPMDGHVTCFADGQGMLSFEDSSISALAFTLSGDELRIDQADKSSVVYQRVAGGPWYPRQPDTTPAPHR
jgi:hypothetical protein